MPLALTEARVKAPPSLGNPQWRRSDQVWHEPQRPPDDAGACTVRRVLEERREHARSGLCRAVCH